MKETLKQRVKSIKQELLNLMEEYTVKHGAKKVFNELCKYLQGHNIEDDYFDFNYSDICTTIFFKNGKLRLCHDCEVWDGISLLYSTYNW